MVAYSISYIPTEEAYLLQLLHTILPVPNLVSKVVDMICEYDLWLG